MKKIIITLFICLTLCGGVVLANREGYSTASRATTNEGQFQAYTSSGSQHKTTATPKVSYATQTYASISITNIGQKSNVSSSGFVDSGWYNVNLKNPVHIHNSSITGN